MYISFGLVGIVILAIFLKSVQFIFRFYRRKNRILQYIKHLPSPNEYPIIGSGFRFLGKSTEEIMQEAVQFMSEMKTPFYAWFAGALVIVIDHPDDVYTVLTSKACMEKSSVYKFFNMGTSLFTAPVNIWRPHRKVLNSTFNMRILQSFIPIFNEKVQRLVSNLDELVGGTYFDITPLMHACTLEMVCGTTLGINIEAQSGKNLDYVEALYNYLAVVVKRAVNLLYHFNFIYTKTKLYKQDRKYLEAADSLPKQVIEAQKKARKDFNQDDAKKTNNNDDEDNSHGTPQIFVEQLFKLYDDGLIDDANIRDQVFLMIFAGNDTTSLTLSYGILLLAIHPDVQQKAFLEIDGVMKGSTNKNYLPYDDIIKLDYIEQIIKETLRLNPVAPYLLRLCTEETSIRDCIIPRDTTIIVNLFTMHRREDIYGADAHEFNPDRFHIDNMKTRNPNAFAPFSLGPRNCIGMRYSYIAMKIILATLIWHYRFTTNLKMDDIRMRYEITLKNDSGNMVSIEKRTRNQ